MNTEKSSQGIQATRLFYEALIDAQCCQCCKTTPIKTNYQEKSQLSVSLCGRGFQRIQNLYSTLAICKILKASKETLLRMLGMEHG